MNALCEFGEPQHLFCFYSFLISFLNNSTVCCQNDSLRKGYVYCKINVYLKNILIYIMNILVT